MKKLTYIFSRYRTVFIFYLFVSVLIFLRLLMSKGSVIGSDWGFPDNMEQMKIFLSSLVHSWTRVGNFFGTRQLSSTSAIIVGPVYLLALLGIPISLTIKVLLISIFALAGANLNLFLRYIGIKPFPAVIGGLVFILSPIFFNYSLIGWIYVLLSLALLPLFIYLILRAIDAADYRYILLAALIFSVAVVQSQTLVWYPIALFSVVVGYGLLTHRFWLGLKYAILLFIVFFLLNLYWLPAYILFPDSGVIGNAMVKSTISLGTSQRLSAYNILRIWGGLFNYQFETSYPVVLRSLSFLVAAIGFSSLFIFKKFKKHLVYLLILFLVPAVFYLVGRQVVSHLPFANLIRDFARFTVLSTFALSVMVAITINQLSLLKGKHYRWLLPTSLLILMLNTYPFISGELFSISKSGFDFRLRTKVWPSEYQQLSDKLAKEDSSQRAIFLPLGGLVSLSDDLRYHGAYQEIPDVYSAFSPIPGSISFSDRSYGVSSDIIGAMNQSIQNQDMDKLVYLSSVARINFIVMRRDIDYYDWGQDKKNYLEKKLKSLVSEGKANIYFDQGHILALKLNSNGPIIDASDQLVTIESSDRKILPTLIDPQVIDLSRFQQNQGYQAISTFFHGELLFTLNDQNAMFSSFKREEVDGYTFFSLDSFRETTLLSKWLLHQQNHNQNQDDSIKNDNIKALANLENLQVSEKSSGEYFVDLNSDVSSPTAYFSVDPLESIKVMVNGIQYTVNPDSEGVLKVDLPGLPKGINVFKVESNRVKPILLKTETTEILSATPRVSFQKINSTDYSIKIENATKDFFLNFAENYNSYWQIAKNNKLLNKSIIDPNQHFVSNDFGNGYQISIKKMEEAGVFVKGSDGSYTGEFHLIFWPEKMIGLGLGVSMLSLLIMLTCLFKNR